MIEAGTASCGKWFSERQGQAGTGNMTVMFELVSWIQGYLSGLNHARAGEKKTNGVSLPDYQTIVVMMDDECRATPKQDIANASNALFSKLKP